jgi:hypothetical protein
VSNFFGDDAFFHVLLADDPVIAKAVEAIQKETATPQAVAVMKYKELQ